MPGKIKSPVILSKIFKYIIDEKKFKLSKHNKRLQKILNIKIIDYMNLSGRYIIWERIGKVKVYNAYNRRIIYEGEYLNGKRNGKGKEYNKYEKLIYKGEYLNGKRNGKGKEYNCYI